MSASSSSVLKNGWKMMSSSESKASYLEKTYAFDNFASAFSFMTHVAFQAEKMDHHPEWLNVYNRLTIKWSTHTAHGVTEKDHRMADHCDQVFESHYKGGTAGSN